LFYIETIVTEGYNDVNPAQFGYESCAPSKSFGPAVRYIWLLHYVMSGKGIFRIDGKEYQVSAGEMFVIPPMKETYYEADANTPWEYMWVGFFTKQSLLPDALKKPIVQAPGVGKIFEDMRRCRGMENGKTAFLASRIWEIISLVMESEESTTDHAKKVLHCLRSEYMGDITIQSIADRLNLDRCYLSTVFKKRYGVSPMQYLMNLRLETAAELMVTYGKSPSIAAASVGYPDIYNFSKMFKKKFGCSPRQYVQNARAEAEQTK